MNLTHTFLTLITMATVTSLLFAGTTQAAGPAASVRPTENVILLHGLCRTSRSLTKMQHALARAGYAAWNVNYPSRTAPIKELADNAIGEAIAVCRQNGATKIDFVTHSMGGILVRSYLARHDVPELGRVVMLTPPNEGSEVVDKLGNLSLFKWINGPAGNELGTDKNSVPNQIGPAHFPVGVIAGDRSINWINSLLLIPGRNDGKVSVARAKLPGMSDFKVIHATHSFIARNNEAIRLTIQFLQAGKFGT
jgi:triacylglycerol lipase